MKSFRGFLEEEDSGPIFDNSYDVKCLSVASKKNPRLVFIDSSLPRHDLKLTTKGGKPADLWKYLGVHELTERKAMLEDGIPYEKAHTDYATPAEKAAVIADCGKLGWKTYEEIMDGYLDKIEHEKIKNPPPDPHVNPTFAVEN